MTGKGFVERGKTDDLNFVRRNTIVAKFLYFRTTTKWNSLLSNEFVFSQERSNGSNGRMKNCQKPGIDSMFSEESWFECIAESINTGGFAYVSSSNTAAENFSRPLHIFSLSLKPPFFFREYSKNPDPFKDSIKYKEPYENAIKLQKIYQARVEYISEKKKKYI